MLSKAKVGMIGLRSLTASGGIETMVKQVASRIARMSLPVTVYCRTRYNKQGPLTSDKVRLVNIPTLYTKHSEAFVHTFLASFAAIFRGERVIHYQALGPALFSFLPRLFGRKTIVTIHGLDWKRNKWGFVARNVLRIAETCAIYFPNRTVVVSKTLQHYLRSKYKKEVDYIPNAIDKAEYHPFSHLLELGLEKKRYILFLSRIVPEKGLHLLIDAFRQIDTDMKLVVVGDTHHDKQYGRELKEKAADDKRILFTGGLFGDDKEEIFSNAYLFVLPSYIEGMSIVLLEAMGHSLCPVVSNIEENLEVIEPIHAEKQVGVSFQCGNAESLKLELERLIKNRALVESIGCNASEKVYREYNWDVIAQRYAAIYQELA